VALAVPVDAARDHLRGGQPPGAATLVEYGDYECPYSRLAYRSVQRVEGRLGDRLRFVFRHFPLRDKHPHAQLAAEAAEEAGAQGRFWELHDAMFSRQRALELQDLRGYALELGIDVAALDAALGDGRHRPRIEDDIDGARRSGVQGTPTLFIEGVPYGGSYEPDDLELALRTASRG
jgi:protein-disulfide isomerase